MMADWADTAHPGGDTVGFFDGAVLHELFIATDIHDGKVGFGDVAFFI